MQTENFFCLSGQGNSEDLAGGAVYLPCRAALRSAAKAIGADCDCDATTVDR